MTSEEIKKQIVRIENYISSSEYEIAKEIALELKSQINASEDVIVNAKIHNLLGNIHYSQSDLIKAKEMYTYALEKNTSVDYKIGMAGNLGNIALIYYQLSNYDKALEFNKAALTINTEIENISGKAIIYGNIGNIFNILQEYEQALNYYTIALDLNRELNNLEGISINLGNIGNIYFESKNYSKALEYYNNALSISLSNDLKYSISNIYGNLGNVYRQLLQFEESIKYFSKSIELDTYNKNKRGLAVNYFNLGELYFFQEQISKAKEYLNQSLSICIEIEHKLLQMKIYEILSQIEERVQEDKLALIYYKQFTNLKDEIHNNEIKRKVFQFDQQRKMEEEEKERQLKIARFQEQEKILHKILPVNIANRIIKQETFIADHFTSVTVLFMDLVGFTPLSSIVPAKQLVFILDTIFSMADEVIDRYGLEKIKTIGDGYMAVGNVTTVNKDHQKAAALAALELIHTMKEFSINIPSELGNTVWIKDVPEIQVRIGIHTGEVVAGVIGKNKFVFDLWGDAVNIASRMESNSLPWKIHVSNEFAKAIEQHPEFLLIPRGEITIKGKGKMNTYWLEKQKDC